LVLEGMSRWVSVLRVAAGQVVLIKVRVQDKAIRHVQVVVLLIQAVCARGWKVERRRAGARSLSA